MSLTLTRRHNVDRFGYLIPHRYGNLPMVGAVATYRPGEGRFGRGAVAVEEGTTNLITQSSPVYGVTGRGLKFTVYGWEDGWYKLGIGGVWTGGTYPYIMAIQNVSFTGGTRYSVSLVGKTNVPHKFNTLFGSINYVNAPTLSGDRQSRQVLNDGSIKVQRLNFGYVDSTYQSGYIAMRPISDGTTFDPTTDFIWVKEVQVEQKPFATSFVDGTRPDGILAYPVALPDDYTIACYRKSHTDEDYKHVVKRSDGKVFVDGVEDSEYDVGWIAGRNLFVPSKTVELGWTSTGNLQAGGRVGYFIPVTPGDIYTLSRDSIVNDRFRVYFTKEEPAVGVYVLPQSLNGDNDLRIENIIVPSEANYLFVYLRYQSAGGLPNIKLEKGSTATHWTPAPEDLGYEGDTLMLSNQTGLIDELLILPYAASEEEIVSWYEAQGPLPPHPQASLQWDRQAVTRRHNVDRFGYLIPTRYGNVPMVGAVATYRPGEGRFGRGAVAVEEATTNLWATTNGRPSGNYSFGTTPPSVEVIDMETPWGNEAVKVTIPANNATGFAGCRYYTNSARVTFDGRPYSYYIYLKGDTSGLFVYPTGSRGWPAAIHDPSRDIGEWKCFRYDNVQDSTQSGYTGDNYMSIFPTTVKERTFYVGAIQLEQKPFSTSFVEGSRSSGTLRIEDIPEKNLTVSFWWKSPVMLNRNIGSGSAQQNYPAIAQIGTYGPNYRSVRLWLWDERLAWFVGHPDTSNWMVADSSITVKGEIEPDTFYMLTFTLEDGKIIKMYFNGELKRATTISKDLDFWENQNRLSFEQESSAHNNALYDELLILPYAASEEEIVSWYEAQGPLPPHPQASLQWDRQAVRPVRMVKL